LRGLNPRAVKIEIVDGLSGIENFFRESFPQATTGRCWVHAMKNSLKKYPSRPQLPFKMMLNQVMYAESIQDAKDKFIELKRQMGSDGQRAVGIIKRSWNHYSLIIHLIKGTVGTLKPTNLVERVNKELKRRTKTIDSVGESTLKTIGPRCSPEPIVLERFLNSQINNNRSPLLRTSVEFRRS